MLTPAQVAKLANKHPNTIRQWSDDYAEFLSQPERGDKEARQYSEDDVEVIRTIAALRASGMPPGEVMERLRAKDAPSVIDMEPEPIQEGLQQATFTPPSPDVTALALHSAYIALQGRVEDMAATLALVKKRQAEQDSEQRELDKLAKERARVEGAIIALVGGGFVLLVVWLSTNGGY